MMKTIKINWVTNNNFYGLDYCTKFGNYKDYTFDIRYDYCGDSKVKPKCGCCLTIYFKNQQIEHKFGNMNGLINFSEKYLQKEILNYQI